MAVAPQIEIDTQRLSSDIQKLRMELQQTRANIAQLQDKMNAMNNMWDGEANQILRQRFQADHEQMLSLCKMIEQLIQTLESIRQSYDTCENNVRGLVNALRI